MFDANHRSLDQLRVYVINLRHRTDRLREITLLLEKREISWQRVDAIHGSALERDVHLVSAGQVGCWLSHLRAYQEIFVSTVEFGLVLEDDATESPGVKWSVSLFGDLLNAMDTWGIDILQLGAVEFDGAVGRLLSRYRGVYSKTGYRVLDSKKGILRIRHGHFGPGTHAYIIRRRIAGLLSEANDPVMLTADSFMMALARSSLALGNISIAACYPPIASQVSRREKLSVVDTDIS